jgi:hypothetical protein
MPAISFTIMQDKLRSGAKKQTIRLIRSGYWLRWRKGDRLVGYWKMRTGGPKLFESVLAEDPNVVLWCDFTDALLQADGFASMEQANREFFIPLYGLRGEQVIPSLRFVVLRWQ